MNAMRCGGFVANEREREWREAGESGSTACSAASQPLGRSELLGGRVVVVVVGKTGEKRPRSWWTAARIAAWIAARTAAWIAAAWVAV